MACNVADSVADVWFRLGFLSSTELATNAHWVTLAELYQFADDAGKRLSYTAGLFAVVDPSISVLAATAAYSLPASHVFTIFACIVYAGQATQILRMSSVGQLFAFDANWPTTSGDPTRASLDAGGVGTLTLYPIPISNGTLNQICQEYPAIASGSPSVAVSPVLQDYFSYALLAGARGKESDFAMPEIAAHAKARMDMYDQVAQQLWGPGQ
jgi:hypothetical protein